MNRSKKHYNERILYGSLGDNLPQQVWDDFYAGLIMIRQIGASKPKEKSRSVVEGQSDKTTTAS